MLYVSSNGRPVRIEHAYHKRSKTPKYMLTRIEIKSINVSKPKKTMGRAERLEAYAQQKFAKWKARHPNDMFPDEALARIRDIVIAIYDKMPVRGRYKHGEKFTPYDHVFATVKDKKAECTTDNKISDLDKKYSPLMISIQKAVDTEKQCNPELVAAQVYDHRRKSGVLVIPHSPARFMLVA